MYELIINCSRKRWCGVGSAMLAGIDASATCWKQHFWAHFFARHVRGGPRHLLSNLEKSVLGSIGEKNKNEKTKMKKNKKQGTETRMPEGPDICSIKARRSGHMLVYGTTNAVYRTTFTDAGPPLRKEGIQKFNKNRLLISR